MGSPREWHWSSIDSLGNVPLFLDLLQTWIVGEGFNNLLFAIFIQQLDLGEDCSKLIINQLWHNSRP